MQLRSLSSMVGGVCALWMTSVAWCAQHEASRDTPQALVETEWLVQEAMRHPGAAKAPAPAAKPAGRQRESAPYAPPSAEPASYPVEETLARGRALLAERRGTGIKMAGVDETIEKLSAAVKGAPAEDRQARRELYLKARGVVRSLVLSDPLLNFDKLLFVKRHTYCSSHIYTDFTDGSKRFGGNLCILSPVAPEGRVTELAPQLAGGIFGRHDLSFDAQRVVFAYKKDPTTPYHLYEIGIDGSSLRQITFDDPNKVGYCDDLDPCFLPDGRIMFTSTREQHAVLCLGRHPVPTMHVIDADGKNMRCVSSNTSSEFTPAVMDDGRVLYTRWEYVDKGCGDVQSLWAMRADGSHSAHVYKNNVAKPPTLIDGRPIPGSSRLVATGGPHMPLAVGPIVQIDILSANQTSSAMTNITPEISWPTHGGYPSAKMGFYKEPWPLSEQLYLVAYNPGPAASASAGYGLYLLDQQGNRELIYRDPAMSSLQPTPLRSRRRPPALHSDPETAAARAPATTAHATLFLQDVYQGLDGIERGRVKYVRVVEDAAKPRSCTRKGSLGLQNPVVSLDGHFAIKQVHGVVKVHEDGSAFFTVPAGRNLYFQALDEDYMELQRMRTFVNLMAGETRSCIGCHEPRRQTPANRLPLAMRQSPQPLQPQPGDSGPRFVHYPLDVQPTLDKHCVRCHGASDPKGGLNLTGEATALFCKSYEALLRKKLVDRIDVNPRDAFIPAEPPLRFGSHRSAMIDRIRKPQVPCAAPLSREEFVRLVTWIDVNAPYYGTYQASCAPTPAASKAAPGPARP